MCVFVFADSLTYIQEDAGLLPRTALITVAGLGGIVAGYKGKTDTVTPLYNAAFGMYVM